MIPLNNQAMPAADISELASVQAGTLPTANANLLTTAVSPKNALGRVWVEFVPSVEGILTVTFTRGATTTTALLYGGATISAGVGPMPTSFRVSAGESINFQFSATGGTYRLIVREY